MSIIVKLGDWLHEGFVNLVSPLVNIKKLKKLPWLHILF